MCLRIVNAGLRLPYRILLKCLAVLPYFRFEQESRNTQTPATIEHWLIQNVLGINRGPYWPVHYTSRVSGWENILAGVETCPGYMGGCYIQGIGKIRIGDYTQIASNVGIISANHSLTDNRKHSLDEVCIGEYCWLGMNSVILPGVTLGDFTVVGAGAIVTKSYPEGHCVIGGNPAKVIRTLNPDECVRHVSEYEYHGYIPRTRFEDFCQRHLNFPSTTTSAENR